MSAKLPPNQTEGVAGYFDVKVNPGDRQELVVTVRNDGEEPIAVLMETHTASTNSNGDVEYNATGQVDETMQLAFAKMATLSQQELTIPPLSEQDVTVTVQIPAEPFEGIILGSIRALKGLTEEEKNSGASIVNQYAYVIAVKLYESDVKPEPEFVMGEVGAELINGKATIVAGVRNTKPQLYKGVKATAQIFAKGGTEPIFNYPIENLEFAPNSIFPFTLRDDAGYGIEAGDYTAQITVELEGKTWNLEKEFTIEPDAAAEMNQGAVNQGVQQQQQQARPQGGGAVQIPWAIIAIVAGAGIVAVVVVMMLRQKKQTELMWAQIQMQHRNMQNNMKPNPDTEKKDPPIGK